MTGSWKFDSLFEAEKLEKKSAEMLSSMFSDMTITLRADGTYNLIGIGKSEDGKWTYNEKKKELEFISDKKETSVFEIVELKDNKTLFRKGTMSLVMVKN